MTQDGGAARGGDDNPLYVWLIGIGLIAGALYLTWHYGHAEISAVIKWIRLREMEAISLVTNSLEPMRRELAQYPSELMVWNDVVVASEGVGAYLRFPIAVILTGLGVVAYTAAPQSKWRKRYNLEMLIKAQAQTWRVITPITRCNPALVTRSPKKPIPVPLEPWAEALFPEEWLAVEGVPYDEAAKKVDPAKATVAFTKQLCGPWRGVEKLPDYLQGLFVAFALKIARRRPDCRHMLEELAVCWWPDKGMVLPARLKAEIQKHLRDPKLMGPALEVASKHAWVATVFLGLLQKARIEGGVLASAEFIWLRPTLRALWYPLNGLGSMSFYTEAGGAMAHFMAEVLEGRAGKPSQDGVLVGPIKQPSVKPAIEALEAYMAGFKGAIPKTTPAKIEKGKK